MKRFVICCLVVVFGCDEYAEERRAEESYDFGSVFDTDGVSFAELKLRKLRAFGESNETFDGHVASRNFDFDTDADTDAIMDTDADIDFGADADTDAIMDTDADIDFGADADTDADGCVVSDLGILALEDVDTDQCYVGNVHVSSQEDLFEIQDEICIIGNLLVSYTDDVIELNLPNLTHIYGAFTITYNSFLVSLHVPNLMYVEKPLMVTMNERLPTCEGYELVVSARDGDGLPSGSLVSGNAMDGCTQSWECYQWDVSITNQNDLDLFHKVSCFKEPLVIESDTLENVSFNWLIRVSKLIIRNSPLLTDISFPNVKYVREVNVTNNESLSTCLIVDAVEMMKDNDGYVDNVIIEDNLDDGCTY